VNCKNLFTIFGEFILRNALRTLLDDYHHDSAVENRLDVVAMQLDEAEQGVSYEALGGGTKCNPAFHMQWELTTRRRKCR